MSSQGTVHAPSQSIIPVTSKLSSSTIMLLWRKSSWARGNGPLLYNDSRLAIALICDGKFSMISTIFSAGIGPRYIMRIIVSLSYLNLTLSAHASKNAVAESNGPPMPGKGPHSYPPSRFRTIVPIFGRRSDVN